MDVYITSFSAQSVMGCRVLLCVPIIDLSAVREQCRWRWLTLAGFSEVSPHCSKLTISRKWRSQKSSSVGFTRDAIDSDAQTSLGSVVCGVSPIDNHRPSPDHAQISSVVLIGCAHSYTHEEDKDCGLDFTVYSSRVVHTISRCGTHIQGGHWMLIVYC